MLTRVTMGSLYHVVDGHRREGGHADLWGDCSDLRGDCSDLWGNLDTCGLTPEQRAAGVDIQTLVAP